MKLLAWSVGVLVILVGVELAAHTGDGLRTVWIIALALWTLYGIGLALAALVRLAMKRGLGSPRVPHIPKKEGE